MGWFRGLSKFEQQLLKACGLLMLACVYLLTNQNLATLLFSAGPANTGRERIGIILDAGRDVRRKSVSELQWRKIQATDEVQMGDSVFAGPGSSAVIGLDGKNELTLEPNSLIRFTEINGNRVGDIALGSFTVKVEGTLKMAVQGELRTFTGVKSEMRISIPKEGAKPKITITQGEVQQELPERLPKVVAKTAAPPEPIVDSAPEIYLWKLADHYLESEGELKMKSGPRAVPLNHTLAWESELDGPFDVQLSSDPSFTRDRSHFTADVPALEVSKVFVGENFWRVSQDMKTWSVAAHFTVRGTYLDDVITGSPENQTAVILDEVPEITTSWNFSPEIKNLILEVSRSKEFPPAETRILRLTEHDFKTAFANAGRYFLRARGVNAALELTDFSKPISVEVLAPVKLGAPEMPMDSLSFNLFPSSAHKLPWQALEGARAYELEVLSGGEVIHRRTVSVPTAVAPKLKPGAYAYRVTAVDGYQRRGDVSRLKSFSINAPEPAPLVMAKKETPPPMIARREPAAEPVLPEAASVLTLDRPLQFRNMMYGDSRLSLEGATFGMVSSEQLEGGGEMPYAATIALRARHWFGGFGLEGAFKTKLFNYNAQGSAIVPSSLEARAMHRWKIGLNWFSFLREVQISAIAGGEAYQNKNNGVFAGRYQLLKAGAALDFPLWERWSTGGEALVGVGLDASKKLELSGFVNYFWQKQWSVGAGYRLHAFEAGSTSSAPKALPYREGYVEGFSSLKYSY